MRSRYSAFATGNAEHLFRTWHPRTRPAVPIETGDGWLGLEVVDVVAGDEGDSTGVVEFVAHNTDGDLRERSRFEKRGGRWFYLDAESR
ncbi:MAG: zinc chelation protein SecC [Propionibacterium sp.]|nr:zinc chelation protein SecC [Propionibacterium sp.]